MEDNERIVGRAPGVRLSMSIAFIAIAVAATLASVAPGQGTTAHAHSRPHVPPGRLRRVLSGDGIGSARFGASPHAVRATIDALLGQDGGPYRRGGSCAVDHQITWWDQWAADGEPSLTAYFAHDQLVGYQYWDYADWILRRLPARGPLLATARGLTIRDTLARGRRLYGRAFTLSEAQGGTWLLATQRGRIEGYAFGMPKHGDVSLQSVVATIDAGDVGCAAVAP